MSQRHASSDAFHRRQAPVFQQAYQVSPHSFYLETVPVAHPAQICAFRQRLPRESCPPGIGIGLLLFQLQILKAQRIYQ